MLMFKTFVESLKSYSRTSITFFTTFFLIAGIPGLLKVLVLLWTLLCQPLVLAGIVAAADTIRTFPNVGIYKLAVRYLLLTL